MSSKAVFLLVIHKDFPWAWEIFRRDTRCKSTLWGWKEGTPGMCSACLGTRPRALLQCDLRGRLVLLEAEASPSTSNCISAGWAKASQPRRGKWVAFAFQLFFSNGKAPGGCSLREEGFILVQSLRNSQSIVPGQACGGGGSFPAGRSTGPGYTVVEAEDVQ